MSRTHIQQSQVSGSLSGDVSDSYVAADALTLAENRTLVSDLNDLRKQLNRVIGEGSWSAALAGQQDLSDIYAAVHMTGANADFMGTLDVTGVATFDAAITGSAGMQLAGDLDVNSSADFQGAVNLQDTLTVGGAADLNGSLDVAGQVDLAAAGVATNVRGTLSVTEVATFSAAMTGSAGMQLAGDLDVNSSADFQGAVNLQDTLTVAGAADLNGALDVAGKADFQGIVDVAGTLSASVIKIDGDAPAGALYLVGADGEIAEEGDLIWTGDLLKVTGSVDVSNGINVAGGGLTVQGDRLEVTGSMGITGEVDFDSTLNVDGAVTFGSTLNVTGKADFAGIVDVAGTLSASAVKIDGDVAQRLYIVDEDGSLKDESKLTFDGSLLAIDGDLKVGGNDIYSSTDAIAISLNGADVAVKGKLTVEGNEIKSTTGTVMELSGLNAIFKADVQVDGDLRVKGATTYIDTQNMRVEDAFIYLATGSAGTTDSGIVLHGGAGVGMDLVIGQDGGAGEVIFGKGNRAPDGDGAMDGIELVPAWMSDLKVGDHEGSLSGSFAAVADGAQLSAPADLLLAANSQTPISFIESGEWAAFDAQFPGSSLVGAIIAAGGNFKQDSFKPGVTTAGGSIDFSSVGALRAASYASTAAKKLAMDVYLNGVRLAYSDDYSIDGSGVLSLAMNTMGDDVLTVVIHNAAA